MILISVYDTVLSRMRSYPQNDFSLEKPYMETTTSFRHLYVIYSAGSGKNDKSKHPEITDRLFIIDPQDSTHKAAVGIETPLKFAPDAPYKFHQYTILPDYVDLGIEAGPALFDFTIPTALLEDKGVSLDNLFDPTYLNSVRQETTKGAVDLMNKLAMMGKDSYSISLYVFTATIIQLFKLLRINYLQPAVDPYLYTIDDRIFGWDRPDLPVNKVIRTKFIRDEDDGTAGNGAVKRLLNQQGMDDIAWRTAEDVIHTNANIQQDVAQTDTSSIPQPDGPAAYLDKKNANLNKKMIKLARQKIGQEYSSDQVASGEDFFAYCLNHCIRPAKDYNEEAPGEIYEILKCLIDGKVVVYNNYTLPVLSYIFSLLFSLDILVAHSKLKVDQSISKDMYIKEEHIYPVQVTDKGLTVYLIQPKRGETVMGPVSFYKGAADSTIPLEAVNSLISDIAEQDIITNYKLKDKDFKIDEKASTTSTILRMFSVDNAQLNHINKEEVYYLHPGKLMDGTILGNILLQIFGGDVNLAEGLDPQILTEAISSVKKQRDKLGEKILGYMDKVDPSGINKDKYQAKFSQMGDQEFIDYLKKLVKSPNNFYLEYLPNKNYPHLEDVVAGLDYLNVPKDEFIWYHNGMDKDDALRTRYRQPVGYITVKRMRAPRLLEIYRGIERRVA